MTEFESENESPDGTGVSGPILAVVGRPNVGKSTLVNRIIGRREAVVEDVPGVTRDRISYDAIWNGRAFTVVDTGGWDPDARGLAERIRAQAEIAVGLADAVLFVVDATVGITDADESVVRILRKSEKPVILAANKVDDARAEAEAYGLWNLGLGEPYPVSALHGRGSGDMLDAILAALPEAPAESFDVVRGPRRVAIVGKPNVGKSSLLNRLAGEERAVVDNVAGTTVDPVDELVELGGRHVALHRHRRHPQAGQGGVGPRVLRLAPYVDRDRPRGGRRARARRQPVGLRAGRRGSCRPCGSPAARWSSPSTSGTSSTRSAATTSTARSSATWCRCSGHRASTSPLAPAGTSTGWCRPSTRRWPAGRPGSRRARSTRSSGRLVAEHPHPVRSGKQPKILFGTQPSTSPPTFVLFTSGKLEASYERYIERRLREQFGFVGTPIVINQRPREKRKR